MAWPAEKGEAFCPGMFRDMSIGAGRACSDCAARRLWLRLASKWPDVPGRGMDEEDEEEALLRVT